MLSALPLRRRTAAVGALAAGLLVGPVTGPAAAQTPAPGTEASPQPPSDTQPSDAPPSDAPPSDGPPSSTPPAAPSLRPQPPSTAADVCADSSPESPVVVDVQTLLPRAPTSAEEPFQAAGRLVNCGDEALSGLQVRLLVGDRLSSRSELRLAAAEPVVGSRRLPAQDAQADVLPPGGSTTFDVRVQVGDLRLGRRNGVYPLAVQARGRTDGGARGAVGLASTFVPWFPEGPVAPTRLAWVVPLVDQPHRRPDGVLLDDALAELVSDDPAPAGRLSRALLGARVGARGGCEPVAEPADGGTPAQAEPPAAPPVATDAAAQACRGEAVPVTYAVDPDLVATVDAMTRPYTVLRSGTPTKVPPSPDATRWLTALRAAVQQGDVLALPYADPDTVALSRTTSPLKDDVDLLGRLGRTEAERLLDVEPLTTVAWPPVGPVAGVVDTQAAGEGKALVVDASVLDEDPSTDRTPSARTTLPSALGPVTALVPDETLSRLVEPDPSEAGWQGPRLAEQRWLAETAMIAAERPGESRTLVVAPDRRADLLPSVLSAAVADTGRLPWLCGVALDDVATGTERCAERDDPQAPAPARDVVAPRGTSVADRALPPAYVRDVAEVRRASDQLTDQVLAEGDAAKDTEARLLRARGRAESSAWRAQPAAGRRMLDLLRDEVAALRSRVTLVGKPVLLTGRVGTVQLVVQNSLDQPVNVGVRLDPTSAARLTSEDAALQVVPGRSSQQVSVQVEARTSGRFTARAGLVDASGQPFGDTVEFVVRSTEYGRVALAITGVAAGVLFVAAGVRITRRALRPGPAAPVEPPEPARPGSGV